MSCFSEQCGKRREAKSKPRCSGLGEIVVSAAEASRRENNLTKQRGTLVACRQTQKIGLSIIFRSIEEAV